MNFSKKSRIVIIMIGFLVTIFCADKVFSQAITIPDPLSGLSFQDETKSKKDKRKKDQFKLYGAVNFNNLVVKSDVYETTTGIGWMLGGSYKRGKFFYWELGGRYNRAVFNLANAGDTSAYLDRIFSVSNVDVPITVGINTLWFVNRIVDVRVFISVVPEFLVGVKDNDLGITKDDLNTFNILGQIGVGVDVAFIFLEAGIDYGFMDLMKDHSPTNPIQGFVSLGFRF